MLRRAGLPDDAVFTLEITLRDAPLRPPFLRAVLLMLLLMIAALCRFLPGHFSRHCRTAALRHAAAAVAYAIYAATLLPVYGYATLDAAA